MKRFTQKVGRSREAMTAFLSSHFRYHTMNSWNGMSSYANCVKIHRLDLTSQQLDRGWGLLDCEETYDRLNEIIREFGRRHDYQWQIGFNGRSSGYLVLYQGEKNKSEYQTVCISCGQKNYRADTTVCGRCKASSMRPYDGYEVVTKGCGTDDEKAFDEWDMSYLRERVRLVRDFDQTCDEVVSAFAALCDANEAVEMTVMVPKTVKVVKPVG